MLKRGKIVRDPTTGPGLVMVWRCTRISLEAGAYAALLAGAQLGLSGIRWFLIARAGEEVGYQWKE